MKFEIGELFTVYYGQREYTNKSGFEDGNTLLISSKGTINGCFGFFNIPAKFKGANPIITVPRTGSIGEAFVQDNDCCVDDDCLILEPRDAISIENLFGIAYQIRRDKWRYNYGRKITPDRLKRMIVIVSDKISVSYEKLKQELIPNEKEPATIKRPIKFKKESIDYLFEPVNARSKGFSAHKDGQVPFVTNGTADNGVIGFVEPLKGEKVFNKPGICVSSFCEATVHAPPFLPRGNGGSGLLVLIPKMPMSEEELFYYATQIATNKWRFSYGRMVTQSRLSEVEIFIPHTEDEKIDKSYIQEFVRGRYGFEKLRKRDNTTQL